MMKHFTLTERDRTAASQHEEIINHSCIIQVWIRVVFTSFCYILWMPDNSGPRTTRTETSRPVSEDESARTLRQLGPYYCLIILFNIYMCIIIYLFKRQLLSFSENELFIKW
jgi:hypothetical protein